VSPLVEVSRDLVVLIALATSPVDAVAPSHRLDVTRIPATRLAFTEQTWLDCVKREGGAVGLGDASVRIFRTSAGHFYVPVTSERDAILGLRHDADIARRCLERRAQSLKSDLEAHLGRAAGVGDIYLAHSLGLEPTLRLILAADKTPDRPAPEVLATEAARHPAMFFVNGRARTTGEVMQLVGQRVAHVLAGWPTRSTRIVFDGAPPVAAPAPRIAGWSATITRAR